MHEPITPGQCIEIAGIPTRPIWRVKCVACGTTADLVARPHQVSSMLDKRKWWNSGEHKSPVWNCPTEKKPMKRR